MRFSIKPLLLILMLMVFCAVSVAARTTTKVSASKVAEAQKVLKDKGLFAGSITGELDAPTVAAIKEFQGANNLAVTGILNNTTLEALGIKPSKSTSSYRSRSRYRTYRRR